MEDEAIIAMTMAETLRSRGYMMLSACSGEEALEYIQKDPSIDLVMMDIDLGPGMDGTEAAAGILASREIPIVRL